MAPTQIHVWEHVFNLRSVTLPCKTVPLLSHLKFDGEGKAFARDHILNFLNKCVKYNINYLNLMCRLFVLTFRGRIKRWLETFPLHYIYTWFEFADHFLDDFEIYDYDKLCLELQDVQINKGECIERALIRFRHVLSKFRIVDVPSKSELTDLVLKLSTPVMPQDQSTSNQLDTCAYDHSQEEFVFENNSEVVSTNSLTPKGNSSLFSNIIDSKNSSIDILEFSLNNHSSPLQDVNVELEKMPECQ